MDSFCGHKFWDNQVTWNTTTPVLTPCFGETVLTWIPSAFLWLVGPFAIHQLVKYPTRSIPWTLLNLTKLILAVILCSTSGTEFAYACIKLIQGTVTVNPVEYYSPFIKLLTFILAATLILLHRQKGVHSSGLLYIFWFLFTIGSLFNYWTIIVTIKNPSDFYWEIDKIIFITRSIQVPALICSLLLACFSDVRRQYFIPDEDYKNECPLLRASFLSQLTFCWYDSMAYLGFKKSLTQEDMWDLPKENKTEVIFSNFRRHLEKAITYTFDVKQKYQSAGRLDHVEEYSNIKVHILLPLIKTFWPQLLTCVIMKFIASFLTFGNPILLNYLISFVGSGEPAWKGFAIALGMAACSLTESLINGQCEFTIYTTAMKMRSAIMASVFRKSLKLSSAGRKGFTTGEIVNLLAVDTQRVYDFMTYYNLIWSAPVQIVIALVLLYNQLGVASFAGLAVMLLLVPFNGFVTIRLKNFQAKLMQQKDKRSKLMGEILNGMKVLKLYAWENAFAEQVAEIRSKEIGALRSQAYLSAGVVFSFSCAPFLVALSSFATFVLLSSDNILNANKAFVSLSLFNILRIPLALLPLVVSFGANFVISIRRINKFLQADEIDPDVINKESNPKTPIIVRNGTFTWSRDETPVLDGISLDIPAKKLVAVVGHVGSGKSSLLSALLGELVKTEGYVNVYGNIAYVPQTAWIQNTTLRQNILFSQPFIQDKYDRVLDSCALLPDVKVLTGGDLTEIGEKGINLSGGQKQRVSLARAVYSNADIYFLDDPLSAVDVHVSKHLFDKVIGPKGLLKNKTRILVTHRVTFLAQVDEIIVLKDGKISEQGSYNDLLSKKGEFANFLLEYVAQQNDDEFEQEDKKVIEQLKDKIGVDIEEMREKRSSIERSTSDISKEEFEIRRRTLSSSSRKSPRKSINSSILSQENKVTSALQQPNKASKLIENETAQIGSVKWSVYFEYFKALGLISCVITVCAFGLSSFFNFCSTLWLTQWSNDALDPANYKNTALRNMRLGVYTGLGVLESIFTVVYSIVISLATVKGSKLIHEQMLNRIIRAPMAFFDTTPLGRILNRFSKDLDVADINIMLNMRLFLIQVFRIITAIVAISLETPFFLIAVVPISVIYLFVQRFYISSSRQLRRIESITRSPVYSHFSETVAGCSSIRAYNVNEKFIQHCYNMVDINNSSYFPNLAANQWLAIRLKFLGNIIVILAAVFAIFSRESLSPGYVGLAVSYALTVTQILTMLVSSSSDLESNIVSIERLLEYTKLSIEKEWVNISNRPDSNWPENGVIEFKKYSTRYRDGLDLVLNEISCKIEPAEKVGIVGRTGAGKSSLTLALFRIIEPASGSIDIDKKDISRIGLHDLRGRLTVIPQDPVLFSGSFRRNFDPFGAHTDAEIWEALQLSHLKNFVESLEAGLDYEIAEGGENISAGQRQLVCLTRAILRKSKILVLDEATAAVDIETDELIQKTIRSEFRDCTIVTIAHRLNTIMDYDRIIVMDKGKIVEFDSPDNLLKEPKSAFYSLAKGANLVS